MGRRAGVIHPIVFVLAILTIGLAGCGGRASHVASTPPLHPRASSSASRPTATAPAATPTSVITPAPTAGWAVYRDSRYGFQVSIPPGWQPASLTWPSQPDPSGFNYYIVQFFPPGPHGQPGPGASSMAPELIEIAITLSGPYASSLAENTAFTREPGTVALGGERVPLYDRGQPGYGSDILRAAETTFRGYPILFEMHYLAEHEWDPAIAQRDISLYLAMMQGFRPTGK